PHPPNNTQGGAAALMRAHLLRHDSVESAMRTPPTAPRQSRTRSAGHPEQPTAPGTRLAI
ncbi:hypothetical protein HMPREF0298_1651, partial [Corynebacterium lipophiloflavum DSM 44291]